MEAVYDRRRDICHECEKDVDWLITPMLVVKHNTIYFGYKCPECGKLVPDFAFSQYRRSGVVVIPELKRTRKEKR